MVNFLIANLSCAKKALERRERLAKSGAASRQAHVFELTLAQRADGLLAHWGFCLEVGVLQPLDPQDGAPVRQPRSINCWCPFRLFEPPSPAVAGSFLGTQETNSDSADWSACWGEADAFDNWDRHALANRHGRRRADLQIAVTLISLLQIGW